MARCIFLPHRTFFTARAGAARARHAGTRPMVAAAVVVAGMVAVGPALAQSRGELLYTTHCISCHSTEMHWRDKRAATDWASLTHQVRRWQGAASLGWTDDDIAEVARHLNDHIYHFAPPADPRTSMAPAHRSPAPGRHPVSAAALAGAP